MNTTNTFSNQKTCKECLQTKPSTEFYASRGLRCKQCISEDGKWAHAAVTAQPISEWPIELINYVIKRKDAQASGARINYKDSIAPVLVELYSSAELTEAGGARTSTDMTSSLIKLVNDLIIDLAELKAEVHGGGAAHLFADPYLRRLRHGTNSTIIASMGGQAEWDSFCNYVEDAVVCVSGGLPLMPDLIRSIVYPLNAAALKMPAALNVIYREVLKPAMVSWRRSAPAEYDAAVDEILDLTGIDYYELDWSELPIAASDIAPQRPEDWSNPF